ncbi:MAG: proline--tRNA ligase [SAR86 cluster bacterium]|uniref:Proline--tRNA ligase n=1 Tax=SAR86 cluster bacterium TaxID=2030880 RepID=A0A2A4MEW2_9GAMM|nr:MAG: proline--tRNA ligase [SAR86 cluster bacterium]
MRASQYLIATLKETPADAEIASHQLMLRAGLIRKLASGMYTWLPLGLRVLNKVAQIIREEMDAVGAMEVSMPVVQSADLWHETGRWDVMGDELLRFTDRHNRDFCLGPTHEEVITDMVRNEYSSYRQLPATFYQIQTKFRDERRPRFGVMRAREFTMKDAYSFHIDSESLDKTYKEMHQAYQNIFTRLGLDFRAVIADSGNIGGSTSHEFHVLADSGEDEIVFSTGSDYAANMEMAEGLLPALPSDDKLLASETIATGDAHSIDAVATLLNVGKEKLVKTLIVHGVDSDGKKSDDLVALLLRGDQELNETKAQKLAEVASPLCFASDELIESTLACTPGSIGPVNLSIKVIADHSVEKLQNFICGAMQQDHHMLNANWDEVCKFDRLVDIRKVRQGDISPDNQGSLSIKRGIEVGHIFQLGTKYTEAMGAKVLNASGKAVTMTMGCYGIGVTRIVAACIEQKHDAKGIIWPENIAPFKLLIVLLDAHKSELVKEFSEQLYLQAKSAGIETLLDDRDKKTSPGVKFADGELMGIPHRLVVSLRGLSDNLVEYKHREGDDKQMLAKDEVLDFILNTINH